MSLISDALKEAQKKRGEKRESLPFSPSPPSPERKRKKHKPFIGLTIFAIILVVFSVYFYFQMEKIIKIRNRNVLKSPASQIEIEPKKPSVEEIKKEISETQKIHPAEDLEPKNTMSEKEKNEPKEKLILSQQIIPKTPPSLPKQDIKLKAKPQSRDQEEVPEQWVEKKESKIEVIRSLISPKKSQVEEELIEIEQAEKNKDWEKACSLWEKIIEKNEKKEYFLNAGVAHKNWGNWKRAEELFLKAISNDPQYLPALNNLAVLYLQKEDFDKAIKYLGEAVKISPSDPEIYVNIGIAFFKKGESQKARYYFEKALNLDNTLYQPYYYLGIIYLKLNETEKALFYFKKLLELAPDDFPDQLKKWVIEKIDKLKGSNP